MKRILRLFTLIFVITLLVSCNGEKAVTFEVPNLTNKTKEQIENVFDASEAEINLVFDYEYSNEVESNVFIKYKDPIKVGDIINKGDKVEIVLSSEKLYLPNLEGLNREEIEGSFANLLISDPSLKLTIEYEYYYPVDNNIDIFIDYHDDFNAGDVIKNNDTIVVYLNGPYVLYPEVSNKPQADVEDIFANLFADYNSLDYAIFYQEYYNPTLNEGTIINYASDVEAGSKIEYVESIVLLRSFQNLILPDLRGLQVYEIEDVFEQLNIDLDRIVFIPDFSTYVNAGEFIKYDGYNRGDSFDISNERINIHYDIRQTLPNLEGLNKFQIDNELRGMALDYTYEYVIDNTQEYDTFAGYKEHEIGDELTPNMSVIINLYSNDDVNVGDFIAEEKQLFISKYIDSGINNQGIELYNPTDEEINLEDYYIAILPGGTVLPREIIYLTGTLGSKETYVIVHTGSIPELLNKSDMQTSLMNFGTSASIQLRRTSNDTYIDSIYDVGNISVLMDREIFVRKDHLTHGRRNYVYLEWIGFVQDHYDLVGIHPYSGYEDPVFELIEDKTFQEFGMTKVKFLYVNDGDTANFESLDPRDQTLYSGDKRVRFLMVDTPEIGEPYKMAAQNFTKGLLETASEIYLQSSEAGSITGTYGRHLALIWANVGTIENPNWKLVNYEILKYGLGALTIGKTPGYEKNPIFGHRHLYQWALSADNHARENNLGLYSGIPRQ